MVVTVMILGCNIRNTSGDDDDEGGGECWHKCGDVVLVMD